MAVNQAAWLVSPKTPRLEVKEAPFPKPGPDDVVVRVRYVAINPLEYKIQDNNPKIGGKEMQYPMILGADIAGEIVDIGSNVNQGRLQQSIIANVSSVGNASAAFQHYVQVQQDRVVKIPSQVPLEQAVVLPLACDTASAGLFVAGTLGLEAERLNIAHSTNIARETLLIWGGSSSVGCCAIQLATAAGYEVFTTASRRNHDLCLSIGATKVFDHTQADVEEKIITALQSKKVVGALDCISNADSTIPSCVKILAKAQGQKKIMTVLTPPDTSFDGSVEVQRLSIPAYLKTDAHKQVLAFIGTGLADGRLQTKPNPSIIGNGLDAIQAGIDAVREGQSATKIVVRVQE